MLTVLRRPPPTYVSIRQHFRVNCAYVGLETAGKRGVGGIKDTELKLEKLGAVSGILDLRCQILGRLACHPCGGLAKART